MNCICHEIREKDRVVLCPKDHTYWRNDKQLASVTKVLKSVWPIKPDFSAAPPDVLENARLRGVEVDELFSGYVNGTLKRIPATTRKDAYDLFLILKDWFDAQKFREARAQIIVADDEIAGTLDLWADDGIYDLKTVSSIEPTYPLQVGAYYDLMKGDCKTMGIIHLNKTMRTPSVLKLYMDAVDNWRAVRRVWTIANRARPA